MMNIFQAYEEAFSRCYPGKSIKFKPAGEATFWIMIDNDRGPRALTVSEMREAVRMLNAGK